MSNSWFNRTANIISTRPGKVATNLYGGIVVAAAVYGGYRGLSNWYSWYLTRPNRDVMYKDAEPVVNAIVDGAVLVGHVAVTAVGTAVVAAVFPVSVPVLLHTGKGKDKNIYVKQE